MGNFGIILVEKPGVIGNSNLGEAITDVYSLVSKVCANSFKRGLKVYRRPKMAKDLFDCYGVL
jgi:hypothetical protein